MAEMLLTEGDRRRIAEIMAQLERATKAKKRNDQLLPLLDAQKMLTETLHWFIFRDL